MKGAGTSRLPVLLPIILLPRWVLLGSGPCAGVRGNELADSWTKESVFGAALPVAVPFRDMFSPIRVAGMTCWQQRWEAQAATTRMGKLHASLTPGLYIHVLDRRSQTALARLGVCHTRPTKATSCPGAMRPSAMTA